MEKLRQNSKDRGEPRRGHFTSLDYHRLLLDDTVRMEAYERAIRALVRPQDVVLDLGCGTGILAMLAARRGAARVHAIESTEVALVARELIEANQLGDRIVVHHADAVTLPVVEPVDLVISEFMGRFLVDDGMLDAVEASARWLAVGARYCPSEVRLLVAPVGDIFFYAVDFYQRPLYGLDFSRAATYAMNSLYRGQLSPTCLLADGLLYHRLVPPNPAPPFDAKLEFEVERGGRIQAFAGWFEAQLTPELVLSTEPGIETHWGQCMFPVPPMNVELGDRIALRLHLSEELGFRVWHWSGSVQRGKLELGRFEHQSNQQLGAPGGVDA